MKTIDPAVLAGYEAGTERNRLRSGHALIEFLRTKELLLENAETRELLLKTVRMLDGHKEIIGLSGHLLAVTEK